MWPLRGRIEIIMNDDELYTIEINIDTVPLKDDLEVTKEKPRADIDDSVKALADKLSELSKAAALIKKDNKDTFDRLREVIFSKNKGAVKDTRERFIEQAEEFADKTEEPAPFVPFRGFWPTYEMMSNSQKKWYFFWRSRVRCSDYPDTSLSYIFLYFYELINGIGIEDDCDGFLKICALWSNYRERFAELDGYLRTWSADYIAIHFEGLLPDYILNTVGDYNIVENLPSEAVFSYILNSNIGDICGKSPVEYISKFSGYSYSKSTFLKNHDVKSAENELLSALRFIENYLRSQSGKGIIETYIPESARKVNRIAYANAIYCRKPKYAETFSFDCTSHKELRAFITAVYKHIENIIRIRTGKKVLLKAEVPKDIADEITTYLKENNRKAEYEKRTKIEVDATRIKDLIRSSNEIRDKLLDGTQEEIELPKIEDTETVEVISDADDFVSKLSSLQAEIILYINENKGSVTENLLAEKFKGNFVQMEIDAINEAAMDYYGDILIDTDGEFYFLQEF